MKLWHLNEIGHERLFCKGEVPRIVITIILIIATTVAIVINILALVIFSCLFIL